MSHALRYPILRAAMAFTRARNVASLISRLRFHGDHEGSTHPLLGTPCWLWSGPVAVAGNPILTATILSGFSVLFSARAAMLWLAYGDIPGFSVIHTARCSCMHNKLCINPHHATINGDAHTMPEHNSRRLHGLYAGPFDIPDEHMLKRRDLARLVTPCDRTELLVGTTTARILKLADNCALWAGELADGTQPQQLRQVAYSAPYMEALQKGIHHVSLVTRPRAHHVTRMTARARHEATDGFDEDAILPTDEHTSHDVLTPSQRARAAAALLGVTPRSTGDE